MTHSQEPWQKGEEHESSAQLCDAEGRLVGDIRQGYGIRLPRDSVQSPGDANIERIIACVNACAGIPTEDLAAENVVMLWILVKEYICQSPEYKKEIEAMSYESWQVLSATAHEYVKHGLDHMKRTVLQNIQTVKSKMKADA